MSSRVIVVTGASRGLGKGIAEALGEAGDTVYVTGRQPSDKAVDEWPGTIEDTAAEITRRGGKGIAVHCDHRDDDQTRELFDRVRIEHGRLDILVNNAFAMPDWAASPGHFWDRPLDLWDQMVTVGVRSSYVASYYAIPLMLPQKKGLIVNTSSPGARVYLQVLPYGLSKVGQDKLAFDLAAELRPFGCAAISFWHGLIKTERTLAAIRDFPEVFEPLGGAAGAESPEFAGRIIDALWCRGDFMRLTGGSFWTAELAREYGVADKDGGEPISRRDIFGAPLFDPIGDVPSEPTSLRQRE